jgi:hypothetical protein
VEPTARGDPRSALRWRGKSTRRLATAWRRPGHRISHTSAVIGAGGYSLPGTRKVQEGASPPERNTPFASINEPVKAFQQAGPPVVSVEAKKKLVGDVAHQGRDYRPKGQPPAVRVYDFADKELGKGCR